MVLQVVLNYKDIIKNKIITSYDLQYYGVKDSLVVEAESLNDVIYVHF